MIIDLTMPIDSKTPNHECEPKVEIQQYSVVAKGGIAKKLLKFHSHFSTHIDAPAHMLDGARTLSDFSIEKFVGRGMVIDVRGKNEIAADLDRVQEGDIVLFWTGHTKKAYDKDFFSNNPIISEKTAQELINKKIKIIGIDSFTPDNEPYTIHKMFFKADILIVENLINLDLAVGKQFQCYVLPLNIKNGDGAPCRVIAVTN